MGTCLKYHKKGCIYDWVIFVDLNIHINFDAWQVLCFLLTDENIVEAVKREVLEETGIQTEFVSLVCFCHMLNFRFGCSDIYFICHLKPLTQDINMDTREIADAKWMDVSCFI